MSCSARMLRAEFPVHRKSTLNGRSLICHLGGFGRRAACRRATSLFGIRRRLVSVRIAHIISEKSLPLHALRVFDPALLALRVATRGCTLLQHRRFGALQARVHLRELGAILDLNSKVPNPSRAATLADRKIDAWILEHPFCVVGLDHSWLSCEERVVEPNRGVNVVDAHVDMQTLHRMHLRYCWKDLKSFGEKRGAAQTYVSELGRCADFSRRAIARGSGVAMALEERLGRGGEQEDRVCAAGAGVSLRMLDECSTEACAAMGRSYDQGAQQRIRAAELQPDQSGGSRGGSAVKEMLHVRIRQVGCGKVRSIQECNGSCLRRSRTNGFGAHSGCGPSGGPRGFAYHSFCDARRFALGNACRRAPPAAVLGQVAHQIIHDGKVRRVDKLSAISLLSDELRAVKMLQVKGKRRRGQLEALSD